MIHHHLVDFANLLKAFIGTNYFSLAFAFRQSGLVPGVLGFVGIAVMTSHCCKLIVQVKYHIINDYCLQYQFLKRDKKNEEVIHSEGLRKLLQKNLNYPDVGRVVFGKVGAGVTKLFLVITQCGFCINYHIFIGNILLDIISHWTSKTSPRTTLEPPTNISLNFTNGESPSQDISLKEILNNLKLVDSIYKHVSEIGDEMWLPPLQVLVLVPLPFFLLFVLIRKVRMMGPISMIANSAACLAYFLVMGIIISEFTMSADVVLFRWLTFPVFLGIVSSAYEAIGCILPIECSMENNSHNYPICLNFVMVLFSSMLAALAILGYLWCGDNTEQIIIQNLPQGVLTLVIQIILLIAVTLTYPLQIYPAIDIVEESIFSGRKRYISDSFTQHANVHENTRLLADNSKSDTNEVAYKDVNLDLVSKMFIPVTHSLPATVRTWKRNLLRVAISVFLALMAVLLRNVFAYVSAFVGAIGSSPLAFVIPFVFHLKLRFHLLPWWIIVKDVTFIIIGLAIMVIGVTVVVQQLINVI